MSKLYPDSHVEIQGFMARHYDSVMNVMSMGIYDRFIRSAVSAMNIKSGEFILDLGCGTGRNACLMRKYLDESGYLLGMDISEEMGMQFSDNCNKYTNVKFKNQRADVPFKQNELFDTVFMSFVMHGLPHEVRREVIKNIYGNLKPGGRFCLLDFSEFKLKDMPFYYRIPFKTVECKYAFDFVERDWKKILNKEGFGNFKEKLFFKGYARLLTAEKLV